MPVKANQLFCLDSSFRLSDGAEVYGFQCMNLLVVMPDGTRTAFTLIEDGFAEALAAGVNPKHCTCSSLPSDRDSYNKNYEYIHTLRDCETDSVK